MAFGIISLVWHFFARYCCDVYIEKELSAADDIESYFMAPSTRGTRSEQTLAKAEEAPIIMAAIVDRIMYRNCAYGTGYREAYRER